jgi:Zn-dependent peptidase ImmA (M78 family)
LSNIPYISYDRLVEVAESFLQEHQAANTIPVPIEEIVDLRMGISIVPMEDLLGDYGIDAFITRDLNEVCVDSNVYRYGGTRFRFSLAHEIAHILLEHQKYLNEFKSITDWCNRFEDLPGEVYGRLETQANTVAGIILVPRVGLEDRFNQVADTLRKRGLPDIEIQDITKQMLAREYDVNALTVHIRLEKENLLSPPC